MFDTRRESSRPQVKQCVWSMALRMNCFGGAPSRDRKTLSLFGLRGGKYLSQLSVQVSKTTRRIISSGLANLLSSDTLPPQGAPRSALVINPSPGIAKSPPANGISSSSVTLIKAKSNVLNPIHRASCVPTHSQAKVCGPVGSPPIALRYPSP